MSDGAVKVLGVVQDILKEIRDSLIMVAGDNPVNRLVALNLTSNLVFAMLQPEDENGNYRMPLELDHGSPFDTRQEMMAYVFRKSATVSGGLLVSEQLGKVMSPISGITKALIKALTPI